MWGGPFCISRLCQVLRRCLDDYPYSEPNALGSASSRLRRSRLLAGPRAAISRLQFSVALGAGSILCGGIVFAPSYLRAPYNDRATKLTISPNCAKYHAQCKFGVSCLSSLESDPRLLALEGGRPATRAYNSISGEKAVTPQSSGQPKRGLVINSENRAAAPTLKLKIHPRKSGK